MIGDSQELQETKYPILGFISERNSINKALFSQHGYAQGTLCPTEVMAENKKSHTHFFIKTAITASCASAGTYRATALHSLEYKLACELLCAKTMERVWKSNK